MTTTKTKEMILGFSVKDKASKPIRKMRSRVKIAREEFKKFGHTMGKFDNVTPKVVSRFTDIDKISNKLAQKTLPRFRAEFLSFLFFGMSLQRTATRIGKAATDSFMKISEGASPAGEALTSLSANFEYLKFTVGEAIGTALIPLVPIIADVVKWFSGIIRNNPYKIFASLATLFTVGAVFAIGGSFMLFVNGLETLGASNFEGITKLYSTLKNIGGLKILKTGIKLAVSAYLIQDMVEKFAKDDFVPAIADALIMAGMWNLGTKGGKILLGIGIAAKFVSDEDFRTSFINFMVKLAQTITSLIGALINTLFDNVSYILTELSNALKKLSVGDFSGAQKHLLNVATGGFFDKDYSILDNFKNNFRNINQEITPYFSSAGNDINSYLNDMFTPPDTSSNIKPTQNQNINIYGNVNMETTGDARDLFNDLYGKSVGRSSGTGDK